MLLVNSANNREFLKNQSAYFFREVSSGIYKVIKSRFDTPNNTYVNSDYVLSLLNDGEENISIATNDGLFANF